MIRPGSPAASAIPRIIMLVFMQKYYAEGAASSGIKDGNAVMRALGR